MFQSFSRPFSGGPPLSLTAQSTAEGPPEDGREKRPKHVGVLYLQTRF